MIFELDHKETETVSGGINPLLLPLGVVLAAEAAAKAVQAESPSED